MSPFIPSMSAVLCGVTMMNRVHKIKIVLAAITCLCAGMNSDAQITQHRASVVEGFITGCKNHKDAKVIFDNYGKIKGDVILERYCKCRANFIAENLTFNQVENIFKGKERMNEQLFIRMENECTKTIEHLLR
jgi:hypothetical protein